MLASGDIHLVVQKRDAADLVMPSKLTNILAAGRPVIATVDPGTALYEAVAGAGTGVATCPDDSQSLAQAILALAQDPERRALHGARARAYAERMLDREVVLRGFTEQVLAPLAHAHPHHKLSLS